MTEPDRCARCEIELAGISGVLKSSKSGKLYCCAGCLLDDSIMRQQVALIRSGKPRFRRDDGLWEEITESSRLVRVTKEGE